MINGRPLIFFPGAIYICTEDVFPNKRLIQMVENFVKKQPHGSGLRKIRFTDNIFIEHASDLVIWYSVFKVTS